MSAAGEASIGRMPRPTCSPISRSAGTPPAIAVAATSPRSPCSITARRSSRLDLRGLRGGLGHHALERALAHPAEQQRAEEALLALGRAGEQLAQRVATGGLRAGAAQRADAPERRVDLKQTERRLARRRGERLQRRPPDPDLPLAQLPGQERDRDRRLLRRGEPQRVGERGDLAAAGARLGDGLGSGGDVVEEHDARVRGMSALPPGPSEPPVVQTLRWLLRPISFLESCRRRFGDAFSITFLGFQSPMVMLSDPEAIRALYTVPGHTLPPGRTLALQPIMGSRSLLLLEGREHLARRKLMLPPFHGARMRAYEATVREVVAREVSTWPSDEPFALHPRMQAITLEVILRAVFGVTDSADRARLAERLGQLLAQTSSPGLQFGVLLSRRFGGPDPLARLQALREEIDALLAAEVAARRAEPGEDILSLLIAARFEDGEPMDDAEIRDQLMTLLLAGHETTATGLAWTFDLLLRHPHVLQRLRSGDDDAYLRAVVAESLRLRPVVPLAGRRLSEELRLNGHVLPPGTDVTPGIWLAHTRPDRYPEPYAFRPERFLEEAPATYAWIPFGGGVRRCIGAAFAEMEMRVALSEIVRRRELRPASSTPRRSRGAT
jgi:cytochrome P450